MKKGQIFVRAKSPSGKWGNHDILDLDEQSFRAFVVDRLFESGLVVGLSSNMVEGDHIEYNSLVEEDDGETS